MIVQDHLQVYTLTLTTRGPLHIGSGQITPRKEYILNSRKGTVSFLKEQAFFDLLIRNGLVEPFESFCMRRGGDLYAFLYRECGLDEAQIAPAVHYQIGTGEALDAEHTLKDIHRFMRDAQGNAYIPGSSLKGALRTVWLLQAVRADQSTGHSLASDDNAAFPEEKYINQLHLRLQKDGSIASDAVNSLFRGVQVSDSKPIPNERMALCGKFDVLPDGSFPKNSKKGIPLFRECAIPGAKVRFKLTLDQSVLKGRITKESLMDAIQQFDTYYEQTYSRHFTAPSGAVNLPQQPHLILGGGSGFFAKSLAYPYLGEEKGLRWTAEQMTQMFSNHKHQDDVKPYGISPHTMKYARFRGQFYPYGYCEVSIL